MKTLINKILASTGLVLLILSSCKKDGALTKVSSSTTTPATLTASTTTPALNKANLTTTAITFTTTAPSYGYNAAYTSTLQLDVKGDNFATPKKEVVLGLGVLSQAYNVQDFNNILLAMNLPFGSASQIEVRIKSSLSSTAGFAYSNVVSLTATPFALVSYIYVPGAYQNWTPATADSLQSATGNGIYTGIINFSPNNLQFKLTPAKNWNTSYGESSGGNISLGGANNLYVPAAGYYIVVADLNKGTYTVLPANYYSVIGDAAQGWSTDVDMKFDNSLQAWTLKTSLVSTGAFKFRTNHDWGISYGLTSPVNGSALTSASGGNITVTASGTYVVSFNAMSNTNATYTAVKQ